MKDVVKYRRDLHQIPELDFNLPKTMQYLTNCLHVLNCSIEIPSKSSICAFFDFQKEESLAFRADMDALAIHEEHLFSFASKHIGNMHACGHDGHMAMLLAFAKYISNLKTCNYNVLLIFQPAEETTGGALAICESGILLKKHVIAIFGFHLWPYVEVGKIMTKPNFIMAKSNEVKIHIYGKSSHIADFQHGIDALSTATQLVNEIYKIFPSSSAYLLKFGILQTGTAGNCISNEAFIKGSLRTYDVALNKQIIAKLQLLCRTHEKKSKCHILLQINDGYPALKNDEDLYQTIHSKMPELSLTTSNFLTDDFAVYGNYVPSLYLYLGTGKDIPLHSSTFDFDEDTLCYGVALYKKLLALQY